MLLRCDQSFPQPIKVYNLDLGDVIPFILTIWKQTACPMAYILAIHAVKTFFLLLFLKTSVVGKVSLFSGEGQVQFYFSILILNVFSLYSHRQC